MWVDKEGAVFRRKKVLSKVAHGYILYGEVLKTSSMLGDLHILVFNAYVNTLRLLAFLSHFTDNEIEAQTNYIPQKVPELLNSKNCPVPKSALCTTPVVFSVSRRSSTSI